MGCVALLGCSSLLRFVFPPLSSPADRNSGTRRRERREDAKGAVLASFAPLASSRSVRSPAAAATLVYTTTARGKTNPRKRKTNSRRATHPGGRCRTRRSRRGSLTGVCCSSWLFFSSSVRLRSSQFPRSRELRNATTRKTRRREGAVLASFAPLASSRSVRYPAAAAMSACATTARGKTNRRRRKTNQRRATHPGGAVVPAGDVGARRRGEVLFLAVLLFFGSSSPLSVPPPTGTAEREDAKDAKTRRGQFSRPSRPSRLRVPSVLRRPPRRWCIRQLRGERRTQERGRQTQEEQRTLVAGVVPAGHAAAR